MKCKVATANTFRFAENSELLQELSDKLKAKIIIIQRNNVPTPKYSKFRKSLGKLAGIEVIVESWPELKRCFRDDADLAHFKFFACKKHENEIFFSFIGIKMISLWNLAYGRQRAIYLFGWDQLGGKCDAVDNKKKILISKLAIAKFILLIWWYARTSQFPFS